MSTQVSLRPVPVTGLGRVHSRHWKLSCMFTTLRTIAHVLLPIFCPSLSLFWFCRCPRPMATCVMTVSVSTLLTGKFICNCLYLNWLSNKSLAKRSFRKVVLADSCRGSSLAMPSISVAYCICVTNPACQEGRNFAPVHAIWPCVFLSALSLWQNYVWVYHCFVVLFRCVFRKCHRSYMLMRRQRFRTFDYLCEFRPSWQVDVAVIVCILID